MKLTLHILLFIIALFNIAAASTPVPEPCTIEEEEQVATEAPIATEAPLPTAKPCDGDNIEEETPVETEVPLPTEKPCDGDDVEEEAPVETEAPIVTEAPAVTEAPTTEKPCDDEEAEEIPEVTEAPVLTEAPVTESPVDYGDYILECDDVITPEPFTLTPSPINSCSDDTPSTCDGSNGWWPISVEGIEGIFCAKENICVADTMGNCPGPNPELPHGSYCGTVESGVLGCLPAAPGTYPCDKTPTISPEQQEEEVTVEYPIKTPEEEIICGDEESVPTECDGSDGWWPISVEGIEGSFCVQQQLCVADFNGKCPGPRSGLPHGAICERIDTGVMGCVPAAPGTYFCDDNTNEGEPIEELDEVETESDYKVYSQNAASVSSSTNSGVGAQATIIGGVAAVGAVIVVALVAMKFRQRNNLPVDDIITPTGEETV